ncbi:hypothetical protein BVC80_9101g266 [Macleaya cordata]|uniref:Uncharacterized protein n=1 Tax=Macleaya cordata TaxID=56857 RepID=A0A200QH45_MACCD|nr:hypothetical protein BVC80_9101g266 [Macleaya cordata]
MLRHKHNRSIEGLIVAPGKIRKRGCSSSSSSSSIVQNYRFKRALLVGKRGGSNTPVPTWKISSRSPYSTTARIAQSPIPKGKQAPVSARKLVATLWQMNEVPSPRMKEDLEEKRNKKEMRGRGREMITGSVQSGSFPPHLSDPSHSPVSDRLDRSGTGSMRKRNSVISQRLRLTDQNNGGFDSGSNANLMEIKQRSQGPTPTGSMVGFKTRLKDVSNGLTTSKELVKILNRFWGVQEHNSSSMSVISALRAEIERAQVQVNHLIRENRSDRNEVNCLMKHFAEEKAAWKCKEQERIEVALKPIKGDLEVEKKLRRRTESLNKTLGRELAETKAALSKAIKELETEKRAREIMEQICDELARGIGEDKAKVEALKRESAMVREEVEKEREMLQLADVLREERVQMKLSEAKYQFEEKNAAVDKLKNELETFLRTKKAKENKIRSGKCGSKGEDVIHLNKAKVFDQTQDGGNEGEVEDEENNGDVDSEEEDSSESDLHSIELNMENNNRSYGWNYGNGAAQVDPKSVSVEEEIKGRKSTSDKITKGSISIERHISDGIGWDFSIENFSSWQDGYDRERFSEHNKQANGQRFEDDSQRCKSIKGLRDNILSRSKTAPAQDIASAIRQWGQPWPSLDLGNAYCDSPNIVTETSFKGRLVENIGESRIQEIEDSKKLSFS